MAEVLAVNNTNNTNNNNNNNNNNNMSLPSSQFVNKVSNIPIVSGALGYAKSLYEDTKGRYQMVGKVEGMVEGFVPQVVQITSNATPVIVTKGLTTLDSVACASLEILEKNVPLLKEEPAAIAFAVSATVAHGVEAVDQMVGKVLVYSEKQMDYFLPEEKEATEKDGEKENHEEKEGSEAISPPAKKQKLQNITRAPQVGLTFSKRISQKAHKQLSSQKVVSTELISMMTRILEKQLGNLKQSLDSALTLVQGETKHFSKIFDAYVKEVRANFALAMVNVEKMTASTVLTQGSQVFGFMSASLSQFVEKVNKTLQQLQSSTNDPIMKNVLEGAHNSLNYMQGYSNYLEKLAKGKASAPAAHEATPTQSEQASS